METLLSLLKLLLLIEDCMKCIVNNTAGDSSANITIYGRTCISHNTLHIV